MKRQRPFKNSTAAIERGSVKICPLCDTLNHADNMNCFTCGWQGQFSRDSQIITLALAHLAYRYGEVRYEHVTGRQAKPVGDFGIISRHSSWQAGKCWLKNWWDAAWSRHTIGIIKRDAALRAHVTSRPR